MLHNKTIVSRSFGYQDMDILSLLKGRREVGEGTDVGIISMLFEGDI